MERAINILTFTGVSLLGSGYIYVGYQYLAMNY